MSRKTSMGCQIVGAKVANSNSNAGSNVDGLVDGFTDSSHFSSQMFHFLTLKIKELKIHIPVYYLCYSNCGLPSCCQLQSWLLLMFLTTRVAQSLAFSTFTFQYGAGTSCFISLTEALHTFKMFDNKLRLGTFTKTSIRCQILCAANPTFLRMVSLI
jgi:hypothetical protein